MIRVHCSAIDDHLRPSRTHWAAVSCGRTMNSSAAGERPKANEFCTRSLVNLRVDNLYIVFSRISLLVSILSFRAVHLRFSFSSRMSASDPVYL